VPVPGRTRWGPTALAVAMMVAAFVAGCDDDGDGSRSNPRLPAGEDVEVERVVDGDTLKLSDGRRVRLIGIDTPETVDPRRPVECLGAEALAHTSELLPPGTAVRLEYDVEHLDRYERTLAYVYRLDDGLFVNLDLLTEGYAEQFTVPPNVARAEELSRAVATARNAGKGLWSGVCGQVGDDG
jgi:micrococcal nuclease